MVDWKLAPQDGAHKEEIAEAVLQIISQPEAVWITLTAVLLLGGGILYLTARELTERARLRKARRKRREEGIVL